MSKLELVEDIFIVLDLIVSFIAFAFQKMGYTDIPEVLFGIGGLLLIVAVIAMICKRAF